MQNLEQLKELFFMQASPLWELFGGTKKNPARLLSKNNDEVRLELSFANLEKAIKLNRSNNDNFVIALKDKPTQSSGVLYVNLDFEKPQETVKQGIDESRILGLQQDFSNTVLELKEELQRQKHQREIDKLVNEYELKLQQLKEASSKKDQMTKIGQTLITHLLAPKAAIGHATGGNIQRTQRSPESSPESEQEGEIINYSGVDFNSVIESVAILKKYIPEAEAMLHNLSVMIDEAESEQSREQLINLLKMYINV